MRLRSSQPTVTRFTSAIAAALMRLNRGSVDPSRSERMKMAVMNRGTIPKDSHFLLNGPA